MDVTPHPALQAGQLSPMGEAPQPPVGVRSDLTPARRWRMEYRPSIRRNFAFVEYVETVPTPLNRRVRGTNGCRTHFTARWEHP